MDLQRDAEADLMSAGHAKSDAGAIDPSAADDVAGRLGGALVEFENAPMPMFLVLPDGLILEANRALRELSGYALDDLVGHHASEFVPPDTREVLGTRLGAVSQTDRATRELRAQMVLKGGGLIPIASSSVSVRDDRGEVLYIVARIVRRT